jgi:hypothetical protein
MLVTANRDFISAEIGDISTGQIFDVDNGIAVYWIGAGLVTEFKPKQWEQIEVKPHIEQEVQVKKSRKRKDAN